MERTVILRALGQDEALKSMLLRLHDSLTDYGVKALFISWSATGVEQLFKFFQAQIVFCFKPDLKEESSYNLRFFYSQKHRQESLVLLASLLKELVHLKINITYRVAGRWEHLFYRSYRKILEAADLPGILIEMGHENLTMEQEEILLKSIIAGIVENFSFKEGTPSEEKGVPAKLDTVNDSLQKVAQKKAWKQTEPLDPEDNGLEGEQDPPLETEQSSIIGEQKPQQPVPAANNQTEAEKCQVEIGPEPQETTPPGEPEEQQALEQCTEETGEKLPVIPEQQQAGRVQKPQFVPLPHQGQVTAQQASKRKRYYGVRYNPLSPPGDAPMFKFTRPALEEVSNLFAIAGGNGITGIPVTVAKSTFRKSALDEITPSQMAAEISPAKRVISHKPQPEDHSLAEIKTTTTKSDPFTPFRSLHQVLGDKITGKSNG